MDKCQQWDQNDLYIGPSTGDVKGSNKGLFSGKHVGPSILCLWKGISINSDYLRFSDYDISNVRNVIGEAFLLDKDPSSIGYADYVQYTLDPTKVNCELRSMFKDGFVALFSKKDIPAGKEFLVSLDKNLLTYYFRSSWNSDILTPIQKQVLQLYDIDIDFARNISNEYSISKSIEYKLITFTDWNYGTINTVHNLPNIKRSCYIASTIQILSHIPAYSRILLESDLGNNLDPSTFLFHYIKFLKIFLHEQKRNSKVIKSEYSYFADNRTLINPKFVVKQDQDCQEYFTALLNKFASECSSLEYVNHHLFSMYVQLRTDLPDCGHYSITSNVQQILLLEFDLPTEPPEPPKKKLRGSPKKEKSNDSPKTYILEEMISFHCQKKEMEYKCPGCNVHKQGFQTRLIHKYPNILFIQLQRTGYNYEKNEQVLVKEKVKYKRYMTLFEGEDKNEVYFELISLVVFKGDSLSTGHYFTYILNSDKQWYLVDDADNPDKVDIETAKDILSHKLVYILVYKKCTKDGIMRDRFDMVMDSYGKDKEKKIAVALHFPCGSNSSGRPNKDCKEIIMKFQKSNCQNISDFRKFINDNEYKLNFWRYYKPEKKEHYSIYNSCVPNGTCGFQLDFLIRERVQHGQVIPKDKNVYIYETTKHINNNETMDYFLHYLKTILTTPKHYFPTVKKPRMGTRNDEITNTYKSYDDWIFIRGKRSKSGEIDSNTYKDEFAYYKFYSAYQWIKDNPDFETGKYPEEKYFRDHKIELWYSINMFNYTKQERKFSIFQNTSNQEYVPHIPNYDILYYIPKYTEYAYAYDQDDIRDCLNIDNSGVLSKQHFYLYPVQYYSDYTQTESLTECYENMNHILEYGEFKYPEYEQLYRWGGTHTNLKRSYKIYPGESATDNKKLASIFDQTRKVKIIDLSTEKGLQELENQKLIEAYLADQACEDGDTVTANSNSINIDLTTEEKAINQITITKKTDSHPTQDIVATSSTTDGTEMCVVPSHPNETNEEKEAAKLFKMLLPNFLFMLKDNNYDTNYEKVKSQTKELLKGYYDNNKEIINNSFLNPILTPESFIDLTSTSNNLTKKRIEVNKKSPNKKIKK